MTDHILLPVDRAHAVYIHDPEDADLGSPPVDVTQTDAYKALPPTVILKKGDTDIVFTSENPL